ncbi:MAG: PHP domain-containing protein [Actinomycetaceae bacterium]|nr:PHP domain-containing protein [Actinomycetaceae bacterium]
MLIDLHTHTTFSDGTDTPAELVAKAKLAGLDVLGIADHDTLAGWEEAAVAARATGISLVRGMELTAWYTGISVHILAYLFNPDDEWIEDHCARMQSSRRTRAQQIVQRLAVDYPIGWDDVQAQVTVGATVGRPHIADALVARGVVADRSAAFDELLHTSSPYYVKQYAPDAVDVVRAVAKAGGKTVWAHPRAAKRGKVAPLSGIGVLADAGLFGVEVDHRDNPVAERDELARIVAAHGLARFGGSDYHGSGKPNRLAEHTLSEKAYRRLIDGTFLPVV